MTLKICLCKGVAEDVIVDAIESGADTFEKVIDLSRKTTSLAWWM